MYFSQNESSIPTGREDEYQVTRLGLSVSVKSHDLFDLYRPTRRYMGPSPPVNFKTPFESDGVRITFGELERHKVKIEVLELLQFLKNFSCISVVSIFQFFHSEITLFIQYN